MKKKSANRVLAALVLSSVALVVLPSAAQQQAPAAPVTTAPATEATSTGGELQKITVTGYLIPRIGDGPQPVETLTTDFIQKQADQTLNDVLNRYPGGLSIQNTLSSPGNTSSPASSFYGLRALFGATLVLVDGYRFPDYPIPVNSVFTFVDINSIPLAAIDRIEILKDGGSATYGSDAAAGVINVITKDQYSGADIVNYFGISQRGDYEVYHGSFTSGLSDQPLFGGKLNLVAAFDYYSQSPIESLDRWYAFGDRNKLAPNYPPLAVAIFPANGGFTGVNTGNFYQVNRGVTGPNITQNDFTVNGTPDSTTIPIDEQLAARETRYGGVLNASYSPTDWLKFYDRFIISRDEENSITPNQGFSFFGDGIVIPANNPFNPWQEPLQPNGQLLREFGPWSSDVITRTLRNIVGATVQLPHDWFIDANFLYGESDATWTVYNAVNKSRLQQALDGTLPGFEGQFFNPFTDQNLDIHPNEQFYDALRTEQILNSRTDIVQWTVKSGGTLVELPGGPVTIAGGYEYRSESLIQGNDHNSEIDNITSGDFQGQLLSARRYINSLYGELDVPLVGGKWSWPGLRNVDIIFSERLDDYSDFGSAAKPKLAIRYKPCDDLTFRGTYSEGFIAPTLGELFSTPFRFQLSVPGQSSPAILQTGGNPNLQPENSYGYYLEAIWTPASKDDNSWWHWAKGFSAYIDWYQIDLRNQISTISPTTLLGAPDAFPGTVIRNGAGIVEEVFANFRNVGNTLTDGIDFGASYLTKEYAWGKLDFELNATYIYKFAEHRLEGNADGTSSFQVLQANDALGFSGPDFKLVASLFYSKHLFANDTFRTGFTLNYIDSEADAFTDLHQSLPAVDTGQNPPGYNHRVGDWTTVDWQISYEVGPPAEVTPETPAPGYSKDGKPIVGEKAIAPKPEGSRWGWRKLLANTTLTFGINNLGDTRPPLSIQSISGFDPQSTTPIGRYFYVQLEKKF